MSNGSDSVNVLIDEAESAIDDIKGADPAKSCQAHEPMARGIIVMLRCQLATLKRLRAEDGVTVDRTEELKRHAIRLAMAAVVAGALLSLGYILGNPNAGPFLKWITP